MLKEDKRRYSSNDDPVWINTQALAAVHMHPLESLCCIADGGGKRILRRESVLKADDTAVGACICPSDRNHASVVRQRDSAEP